MEAKNLLLGTSGKQQSKTNKQKIKLLQQITTTQSASTKPPAAVAEANKQSQQLLQQKAAAEDLQSIIQEKLNFLQMDKNAMDQMAKEKKELESQWDPKHVNTTAGEMLARIDAIQQEFAQDEKKQVEELNKYFQEVAFEELKNVHKEWVRLKVQEEIICFKCDTVYEDHLRRANIILSKYEILTREY